MKKPAASTSSAPSTSSDPASTNKAARPGGSENRLRHLRTRMLEYWRSSLQVRLIVSIFVSSLVVMLVLAFALISVITQRLVDQKLDVASQEIDRARFAVEQQINATGSANSVQVRITSARASISHSSSESSDASAIYDTIIVVDNGDGSLTTAPEGFRVPAELRRYVSEGHVSYQFTPVERADGTVYDALLIGSPTQSDIPGAQVYLALSARRPSFLLLTFPPRRQVRAHADADRQFDLLAVAQEVELRRGARRQSGTSQQPNHE